MINYQARKEPLFFSSILGRNLATTKVRCPKFGFEPSYFAYGSMLGNERMTELAYQEIMHSHYIERVGGSPLGDRIWEAALFVEP